MAYLHRAAVDQILSDLGTGRLSERAPAEDFERFEGELHQIMAAAERALLAHELEQLDVPDQIPVPRPAVVRSARAGRSDLVASRGCSSAPWPSTRNRSARRSASADR